MTKDDLLDYETYVKQGEPEKGLNCYAWQIGIGLQAVDGLKTSKKLHEVARKNIDGDISIEEAESLISKYYENKKSREEEIYSEEADKVAVNIRRILASKSFTFSIIELLGIHEQLFRGIFKHAGKIRTYNVSKKEWVLDGDSVYYSNSEMIMRTLEYDFDKERKFSYIGLSSDDFIKHFSRFIANIWQIHPFEEGNTRTTAVFAIKYLNMLGFTVSNNDFINNSWYFRNALVRANYSNVIKGISMDCSYLELFFRNILLNENNILKNRNLHIENLPVKSENLPVKSENLPVNKTCALILSLLNDNPDYTYEELATLTKKTRETIRVNLRKLEEMNLIKRVGSDKNGHWETLFNSSCNQ